MSIYARKKKKRAYAHVRDQHGREWGAKIETATQHPTGPPQPKFKAPLYPPAIYVRPDPGDHFALRINYEAWLRQVRQAWEDRDTQLRETAVAMYGQEAPKAIRNPQPELLEMLGPEPPLRPELIEAAMEGNKWILGLTDVKPAWAEEFFPEGIERRQAATQAPSRRFPDADEERVKTEPDSYVFEMGAPGRWKMPDGEWFQGKKLEALAHLEENFPEHAETILQEA